MTVPFLPRLSSTSPQSSALHTHKLTFQLSADAKAMDLKGAIDDLPELRVGEAGAI